MADKKTNSKDDVNAPGKPEVSNADDVGQKGTIKDNPDKPDPTSIAQVQVLDDEE